MFVIRERSTHSEVRRATLYLREARSRGEGPATSEVEVVLCEIALFIGSEISLWLAERDKGSIISPLLFSCDISVNPVTTSMGDDEVSFLVKQ